MVLISILKELTLDDLMACERHVRTWRVCACVPQDVSSGMQHQMELMENTFSPFYLLFSPPCCLHPHSVLSRFHPVCAPPHPLLNVHNTSTPPNWAFLWKVSIPPAPYSLIFLWFWSMCWGKLDKEAVYAWTSAFVCVRARVRVYHCLICVCMAVCWYAETGLVCETC